MQPIKVILLPITFEKKLLARDFKLSFKIVNVPGHYKSFTVEPGF